MDNNKKEIIDTLTTMRDVMFTKDGKCYNAMDYAINALSNEQEDSIETRCDCYYHGLEKGDTLYKLESWDGGLDFVYLHNIKYCPKCGRKLTNYDEFDTLTNKQKEIIQKILINEDDE